MASEETESPSAAKAENGAAAKTASKETAEAAAKAAAREEKDRRVAAIVDTGWRGDLLYGLSWYLIRAVAHTLLGYRVYGAENLPREGGYLMVCNHVSNLDPPLVSVAAHRRMRTLTKIELYRVPVLGWFLRTIEEIPIKRGEPDRASLRRVLQLLRRGDPVLIFPEGTRSPTGELREAQRGAAMIWAKSGVPLVPVYIAGSHALMPPGAKFPRPGSISIHIGPAVPAPGDFELASGGAETYARLAKLMMRRIRARQAVAQASEGRH